MILLDEHACLPPPDPRQRAQTHLSRSVLKDYYSHVLTYPDTLLTRFFGLHRVKPHGGRNVRFVVMGNLLNTGHAIHRRYDLKGSTFGRLTRPPYDPAKKILKDLDIEYTFQLDDGYAARLRAQLAADALLLERLNIMDYSLLLGVHFTNQSTQKKCVRSRRRTRAASARGSDAHARAAGPARAPTAPQAAQPRRAERADSWTAR